MPTPLPPKTQLSHMPVNGDRPASGLRLSCSALTEPQVTSVVTAAKVGAGRGAEAQLLAFEIAEVLVDRQPGDGRADDVDLAVWRRGRWRSDRSAPACAVRPGFGCSVSQ